MKTLLSAEELELLLGSPQPRIFDEKARQFTVYSKASKPQKPFIREDQLAELRRRGTCKFLSRLLGKYSGLP